MVEVDKDWTFEQVMEANERALENDPELPTRVQPLFVWSALHDLARAEQRFQSGDNFALMQAIQKCAVHDIPLPDWVARAYLKKFRSVLNYRVGSWDEAFGRPNPKGMHLKDARQRRELGPQIYLRIREILAMDPNTPIDEGLFETVGEEFGIKKTLTGELWYAWEANRQQTHKLLDEAAATRK